MYNINGTNNIRQRLNRLADILRALAILVLLIVFAVLLHVCVDSVQFCADVFYGGMHDVLQQAK